MLYFFYMSDERILQSSGRQSISFHHIGVEEEEEDHLFLLDSRVLSLTPFFPLRLNSIIPHVSPTLS